MTPKFNFYDGGCKETRTEIFPDGTGGIVESIAPHNTELGVPSLGSRAGLAMNRTAYVNVTLSLDTIAQNTLIYTEDMSGSQVTAEIRFCLRFFGLQTKSATPVEVNFLEALVTLNANLSTDGFEIGIATVKPKDPMDRLVRTAN